MSGYTKLFQSILESSVWGQPDHVRLVWVTMLAMADRDGVVEASVPGLAHRARVTRDQCREALDAFLAPDPDSRTKDHDGRRIAECDGGWCLLNYEKYRHKASDEERREKAAERQRRFKDTRKPLEKRTGNALVTHGNAPVTPGNAPLTRSNASNDIAEAEAEAEAEGDPPLPPQSADSDRVRRGLGMAAAMRSQPGTLAAIVDAYATRYHAETGQAWLAESAQKRIVSGSPQRPHYDLAADLDALAAWLDEVPAEKRARALAALLDGAWADDWMRSARCPTKRLAAEPGRWAAAGSKRAGPPVSAWHPCDGPPADASHAAVYAEWQADGSPWDRTWRPAKRVAGGAR